MCFDTKAHSITAVFFAGIELLFAFFRNNFLHLSTFRKCDFFFFFKQLLILASDELLEVSVAGVI